MMEITMSLIINKFTLFEASLQRIFTEFYEDFPGVYLLRITLRFKKGVGNSLCNDDNFYTII